MAIPIPGGRKRKPGPQNIPGPGQAGQPPIVPTSNMRATRPQQTQQNPVNRRPAPPAPVAGSTLSGVSNAPAPMVQQEQAGQGTATNSMTQEQYDNSQNTDYLANQAMIELLGQGPRDTSADEARIQQQMLAAIGQGQADMNARMGAAGFGTSGALASMGADMRAKGALDASGQIMDLQQNARDEHLDRLRMGFDSEFRDRGMDQSEEQFNAWLEAMMAALGEGEAPASPGHDSGNIAESSHAGADVNNTNLVSTDPANNEAFEGWPQSPGILDAPEPDWVRVPGQDEEGVLAYADKQSGVIRYVKA